jgi:hypothetical protein
LPLVVTVRDSHGDPVPNHTVVWVITQAGATTGSGGVIFCGIHAGTLAQGTMFFGDQASIVTNADGVSAIEVNGFGSTGPVRIGVASGPATGFPEYLGYFDLTVVSGPSPGDPFAPPQNCLGFVGPPPSVPPASTTAPNPGAGVTTSPPGGSSASPLAATGRGVSALAATATLVLALGVLLVVLARRTSHSPVDR